ncbi:glycosyltransferase [Aerococcaceae bacterium NML160702]|nr:glycosyltransferase [Aerococcaceae bacterium NML160702]
MRVLHIMSGYGGGISSFIRNKAEAMRSHQVVFDVVTYDVCADAFVAAIQATGGEVYQLLNPKQHGWRAFVQSLSKVLAAQSYDAVHCHISGYRVIPYALLCRKFRVGAFYIHAHYTLEKQGISLSLQLNQWINRHFSQAKLGCSDDAVRSIYGWQTADEELMVIPNSIDVQQYQYTPERYRRLRRNVRQQYQIADDVQLVGQIGRLTPIKNHALTLQLATQAQQEKAPICFLIVGAGELDEVLRREVAQLHLEEYVFFTGRVEPIAALYPALDALIMPSFREGLPTVVVESQAAGVPVVMSETITDEVDLQLNLVHKCALNHVEDWYEQLRLLPQQSRPMAEERLALIEQQKFSNEASAQLYVDFLTGKVTHYRIIGGGHS